MMKNEDKYQGIIDTLKSYDVGNNKIFTGLIRKITITDIAKYEVSILDGIEASVYLRESPLGSHLCALFFSHVTPLLFSEEQMKAYFLNILIHRHNDEINWKVPLKYKLFKEITGFTHEHHQKRNFILGTYYDAAYEIFTQNYYYPKIFIDEVTSEIAGNHTLSAVKDKFYNIYATQNKGDSFLLFLDKFVLDVVGAHTFELYMDTMIRKYVESLEHNSVFSYSTDRILDYIFGYHWSFSMHMKAHVYSDRRSEPAHLRIHKIILKKIFPYVISKYNSNRQRQFVYDALDLSTADIEKYEKMIKSIDRNQSVHYELITPDDCSGIELPSGTNFDDLFKSIDSAFENYRSIRIAPSKRSFLKNFQKSCDNQVMIKDVKYCLNTSSMSAILKKYVDNKIIELKRFYYETNNIDQTVKNDIWIMYYPYRENYSYALIDFSTLPNKVFKNEMKMFVKYYFFYSKSYRSGGIYNVLMYFINYLHSKFDVAKSSDIKSDHVLLLYHHLEISKGWKPITIRNRNSDFNAYFNYLITQSYLGKPKVNPLINISLPNAHSHCQKTKSIPDDILLFLDQHIHELRRKDVILMYHLLMESGWRFGDMLALTDNCAEPDKSDPEIANIWVSSPKTKKHRIKNRLGDVLEDIISISTYELMQNYIQDTHSIREKYGVNTLFYTLTNGVISKYQVSTFNKAINRLCHNYGVKSIDESYWATSTRQTRKTVATSLISSGASLSAVQKKLGHTSSQTTELIYAEVQNKRISELNTEFYKNKFDILMDDEKLKLFTEEERRHLYIDFHLNKRDVELGVCTKHPSEGRCSILGYTSCAECPKICTGKKYLDRWKALAMTSDEIISELEKIYADNLIDIDDYKNYIEYTQEKKLLAHYNSVIQAIESNP